MLFPMFLRYVLDSGRVVELHVWSSTPERRQPRIGARKLVSSSVEVSRTTDKHQLLELPGRVSFVIRLRWLKRNPIGIRWGSPVGGKAITAAPASGKRTWLLLQECFSIGTVRCNNSASVGTFLTCCRVFSATVDIPIYVCIVIHACVCS